MTKLNVSGPRLRFVASHALRIVSGVQCRGRISVSRESFVLSERVLGSAGATTEVIYPDIMIQDLLPPESISGL